VKKGFNITCILN